MAGTRLLVHSSFLLNLLILLGITFYIVLVTQQQQLQHDDENSMNKNGWFHYYRGGRNYPTDNFFASNRNGISLLNTLQQDVDCFKNDEKEEEKNDLFCVEKYTNGKNVKREVHIITFQLSLEEENDISVAVLQSLATALEDGFNSIQREEENGKIARVQTASSSSSPNKEKVYPITLSFQDDDAPNGRKNKGASIEINTEGTISITIHHNTSNNNNNSILYTKQLLQTNIAQLIYNEMITIMLPTSSSSSSSAVFPSTCNTLLTLIDEDPSSFVITTTTESSFTAKDHHLLLNKMLTKALANTLYPMFHTLSPLCPSSSLSSMLNINTVLYGSLSDGSSTFVYKSSSPTSSSPSSYHSVPASKLKSFWKDHSYSIVSSSFSFFRIGGMKMQQQQQQQDYHHLVLYVPTKSKIPLYYTSKKQNNEFVSAFEIKNGDKKEVSSTSYIGAVSIVNLQQQEDVIKNETRKKEMYYNQIMDATSYLISHVRFVVGLQHRLQPWLRDTITLKTDKGNEEEEVVVSLRHVSPSYSSSLDNLGNNSSSSSSSSVFVTNWEMDLLLRKYWYIKFNKVVQELDMLIHLMMDVKEIPCTLEMAQQVQKAIHLLHQALSTAAASQDDENNNNNNKKQQRWEESTIILQQALDICNELKSNADMMEPIHFLPEYILAVFAPLLLPLFMPLVLGLVREIKRYKKLNAGEPWDVDSDDDEDDDDGDKKNGDDDGNNDKN